MYMYINLSSFRPPKTLKIAPRSLFLVVILKEATKLQPGLDNYLLYLFSEEGERKREARRVGGRHIHPVYKIKYDGEYFAVKRCVEES